MTEPAALRSVLSHWLRVRASVRALAAKIAAAEYAMQQNARRSEDATTFARLIAQLGVERAAFDMLGAELDARIAEVDRACRVLETAAAHDVVAHARTGGEALKILL